MMLPELVLTAARDAACRNPRREPRERWRRPYWLSPCGGMAVCV